MKAKKEGEDLVKVGYRLPPDLIKRLEESAISNRRSVNDEMITILKIYFAQQDEWEENQRMKDARAPERWDDLDRKVLNEIIRELGDITGVFPKAHPDGFQPSPGRPKKAPEPDKGKP